MSVTRHNPASAGRRSLTLILLSWFFGASAAFAADAPPLILEHLGTEDGLPQATVMTSLQDSQGFVWLGTEDGLVRFDGHELFRYAHSRTQPESLPGNFIWQVVEDARHDLWIAIKDAGVARWNRATDTFNVYRHDAANPASLASDSVRAILVDARGRIWIGTSDAGVDILDPVSGRIEHLRHQPDAPDSLASDRHLHACAGSRRERVGRYRRRRRPLAGSEAQLRALRLAARAGDFRDPGGSERRDLGGHLRRAASLAWIVRDACCSVSGTMRATPTR